MTHESFQTCIDACVACAQQCEHCASACLVEANVAELADCIRYDRDCADVCWAAATLMSRASPFSPEICRVCGEICEACAAACEKHDFEHCQRCAGLCRHCSEQCFRIAGTHA